LPPLPFLVFPLQIQIWKREAKIYDKKSRNREEENRLRAERELITFRAFFKTRSLKKSFQQEPFISKNTVASKSYGNFTLKAIPAFIRKRAGGHQLTFV
jgi:hypothetical protein